MLQFIDKHKENDYRFYSFVNMYLSPLQKGLQTAHVIAEMTIVLNDVWDKADQKNDFMGLNTITNCNELHTIDSFDAWKMYHKTIIILDGGMTNKLDCIYNAVNNFIEKDKIPIAVARFYESVEALNGCLTCVGMILPKCIYENAANIRNNTNETFILSCTQDKEASDEEKEFYSLFNSCRLAT